MNYIIENKDLKVSVSSSGAELTSVINKSDGRECIWTGDKEVWSRHAPILFPYTGKLKQGHFSYDGKTYEGVQHGFARDMEHSVISSAEDEIVFCLNSNDETKAIFPFNFRLYSIFKLQGNKLSHTLKVLNCGSNVMNFGIGYHPAFAIPFEEGKTTEDYEFMFDSKENPIVLEYSENGLLNGNYRFLGSNMSVIPITDRIFDNDSICMTGLKSSSVVLKERGTGRNITCVTKGFPYVLVWGKCNSEHKLPFVCIEPWMSLPDSEESSGEWIRKPSAAFLEAEGEFSCTLEMVFNC